MEPTPSPRPRLTIRELPGRIAKYVRDIAGTVAQRVQIMAPRIWNAFENVTIGSILRLFGKIVLAAFLVLVAAGAVLYFLPTENVPPAFPVDNIVYLANQGWGANREAPDRETYYYTPQGANIKKLRYSWFVNFERPLSTERFADPEHMRRYRFLVDMAPTPRNPDLLPVGFARYHDLTVGEDMLDITCAACHTGELHIQKGNQYLGIRIDGGQALHAFTSAKLGHFLPELLSSMTETYLNPFKYTRFAKKVLGSNYPNGYWHVHSELGSVLGGLLSQAFTERSHGLYPTEEGFGRTDATGHIANQMFGFHLDDANLRVGMAPVSYPPVWDIWKFDWEQYAGFVRQPLARNLVESLGVGADFRLLDDNGNPVPEADRYATSSAISNQILIEEALQRLKPPTWPEDILGPIDCRRITRGKALFQQHCQGCHGPHENDELKAYEAPLKTEKEPHWEISMLPVSAIGTDANAALAVINNRYDLSKSGLTAAEVRRVLLPELVMDEKGFLTYLDARIKALQALQAKNPQTDCWTSYGIANLESQRDGSGPCREALQKLNNLVEPAKQAACNGPAFLKMLVTPECAEAFRAYEKAVMDIGAEASRACPNISRVLDKIDMTSVSMGAGMTYIGTLMREKYYRDNSILPDAQIRLNGFGILDLPQEVLAYKARPLAGVWATAPYLHNGSVPTLYQMLSPVSRRSRTFPIGHRTFDPVNVGLTTEPLTAGGFWFDTTITGNSNSGHEFRAGYVEPCRLVDGRAQVAYQNGVIGPELSEEERFDLIEYLKIHVDGPDDPAHPELPAHCSAGAAPKGAQ